MAIEREFTATQKLQIMSVLTLYWNQHLTMTEFKVMSWLVGNTIIRGKRSGTYALSQIVGGIQSLSDETWWCFGTGLSRRSVVRAVKTLQEKGAIIAEPTRQSTRYTVNVEWEPWLPSEPQE